MKKSVSILLLMAILLCFVSCAEQVKADNDVSKGENYAGKADNDVFSADITVTAEQLEDEKFAVTELAFGTVAENHPAVLNIGLSKFKVKVSKHVSQPDIFVIFDYYIQEYSTYESYHVKLAQTDSGYEVISEYACNENVYSAFDKKVDAEKVRSAEDKLDELISSYNNSSAKYLQIEDGKLYLCSETIVSISGSEGVGCDIDHKHIFNKVLLAD